MTARISFVGVWTGRSTDDSASRLLQLPSDTTAERQAVVDLIAQFRNDLMKLTMSDIDGTPGAATEAESAQKFEPAIKEEQKQPADEIVA